MLDVRSFLNFSLMDLGISLAVFLASHSFFVLRERLITVLILFVPTIVFHLFEKKNHRDFLFLMGLFFCSFWLLEISYPLIGFPFWPVDQFIGAFILFVFSKYVLKTNVATSWSWRFDKKMLLSIVAIVIPSLLCLILYFMYNKDIADKFPLPQMPTWAIPLAVFLIALINGLREEIYFRFTLQNYLAKNLSPQLAILCASIVFGYMHYQSGFPAGGTGVVLTILFGLLIGTQFYYFKSATLTWMTHSVTDAVMFAVILLNKT
jgi:membrane protease YdiL (CAAX protease family)